jgi:hypothetical protein
MLEQAAGYAFLAALTPTAFLITAVYLAAANPRRTLSFFLIGAVLTSAVVGVIVLLALHAGGLNHPHQRQPRYGLRLGLGVLALCAAVYFRRRKPKPPDPNKKPGLVNRLVARPAPGTALAAGMLVFAPSVSFIAAVQVIATARASTAVIVLGVALIVAIDVLFAWLPLVLHLVAPGPTTRWVKAAENWVRANGRLVAVTALAVAGVLLVIDGSVGLAS